MPRRPTAAPRKWVQASSDRGGVADCENVPHRRQTIGGLERDSGSGMAPFAATMAALRQCAHLNPLWCVNHASRRSSRMNHSSWQIDSLLQTESVVPLHSAGSIPKRGAQTACLCNGAGRRRSRQLGVGSRSMSLRRSNGQYPHVDSDFGRGPTEAAFVPIQDRSVSTESCRFEICSSDTHHDLFLRLRRGFFSGSARLHRVYLMPSSAGNLAPAHG